MGTAAGSIFHSFAAVLLLAIFDRFYAVHALVRLLAEQADRQNKQSAQAGAFSSHPSVDHQGAQRSAWHGKWHDVHMKKRGWRIVGTVSCAPLHQPCCAVVFWKACQAMLVHSDAATGRHDLDKSASQLRFV